MSSTAKKQSQRNRLAPRLQRFPLSIVRFAVSVYRGYLKLHIWSMAVALIIVAIVGQLLTRNALLLVIMILVFIFLHFLDKWLEKYDTK